MSAIIIILIGAISNSFFRGGFIKHWLPNFRGGKLINISLFGLCAYYLSHSALYSILMSAGLMIGQAPALFHGDTDRHKASGNVWAWAGVIAERGAIWALPMGAITFLFFPPIAPYWALLAVAMPVCYLIDWKPYWWRWAAAEALFGAFYYGVLSLTFFLLTDL